jgi:hypothetical protein
MVKYLFIGALCTVLGVVVPCVGQMSPTQTTNQGSTLDRVLGEVTEIDSSTRQMTLSTAAGKKQPIKIDDKAIFRRVPPGEKSLDKAVEITLADIGVGDRVLARGAADDQTKVFLARALVVMSKAEITKKSEADRAEWVRRSISGVVKEINPQTKEITMVARTSDGEQSTVITTQGNVRFRRYAPDSNNFSNLVQSSFDELKTGDQLRVLGEKGADGARYKAEDIISGRVRTSGGPIVSLDANSGEIMIDDVATRKPLKVVINKDSVIRRFTPELVKQLQAAEGGKGGGNIQNMIDHLPSITVAQLKPGNAIMVSSMVGVDPTRVNAVMIAAGVEEFLKWREKQSKPRELNLGLGLPAGAVP